MDKGIDEWMDGSMDGQMDRLSDKQSTFMRMLDVCMTVGPFAPFSFTSFSDSSTTEPVCTYGQVISQIIPFHCQDDLLK